MQGYQRKPPRRRGFRDLRRGPRGARRGHGARYAWTPLGDVAEWLRSGLQSRLHRFDSGRRLMRDCGGFGGGVAVSGPLAKSLDADRQLIEPRFIDVLDAVVSTLA